MCWDLLSGNSSILYGSMSILLVLELMMTLAVLFVLVADAGLDLCSTRMVLEAPDFADHKKQQAVRVTKNLHENYSDDVYVLVLVERLTEDSPLIFAENSLWYLYFSETTVAADKAVVVELIFALC